MAQADQALEEEASELGSAEIVLGVAPALWNAGRAFRSGGESVAQTVGIDAQAPEDGAQRADNGPTSSDGGGSAQ